MFKTLEPCLVIGPRIVCDDAHPAPIKPTRALTLTQEILGKRGIFIGPTNREPFDPENFDVASLIPAGYKLANVPTAPMRRYIARQPDERIAKACSEDPSFRTVETAPQVIVKTGATPVERPRIAGTISKESYRESIASSEAQAQEVQDRIRARHAADPALKASAQRSDGSYYRADGTPHENLSMTRQPADRDAHPGVGPISYKKAEIEEMSSFHKKIVSENAYRRCAAEGCREWVSSFGGRTKCPAHCYKS